MQNPNEDTEWNDILRAKGILPPKKEKEITEDDVINLVEQTVREKQNGVKKDMGDMSLDELDELEDDEDERVLEEYRRRRISELKEQAKKDVFGEVIEINGQDFVNQINKAGSGIWVVLLLYKQGIPTCALMNEYLNHLARKFPATKFVKSISTTCIPNYPDSNLPTIFIYFEGDMKHQFIGPRMFSLTTTQDEFEWMLGQAGAVKTAIKENPRPKARDVMFDNLLSNM
ncbi:viral IAP-associated factor homolog [Adelges cooleyi]|uniref:viral IAP-associated factor homolog n=1 Tax=Adelges cooleyi TaxID=133065 RepID=UPI00217F7A98|nr:viral IAP-associated factor homolog [Adelges cooleyi]